MMADGEGPIVVSVINMKGGVGKTTVATLLGRYANSLQPFDAYPKGLDLDTLLIDLDPQANLSQSLMGTELYRRFLDRKEPSIVEIFNGYQAPSTPLDIERVVRKIPNRNFKLIPSRFDFSNNLINAIGTDPRVLARLIADNFQDEDLIFIDCAPTESIFTQVAYHASHYILVPVKPEFLATIGFPLLQDSLLNFKNSNPTHPIDVLGVVINDTFDYQADDDAPEKRASIEEIDEEARKNGWYIFDARLEYSRGFPKMMRRNYNHLGNAPDIFNAFAVEFFDRLGISRRVDLDELIDSFKGLL